MRIFQETEKRQERGKGWPEIRKGRGLGWAAQKPKLVLKK